MKLAFFIILPMLLGALPLFAEPQPIVVSSGMSLINQTRSLEILPDPKGSLAFDQVKDKDFQKIDKDCLMHLTGVQWFRGILHNPTSQDVVVSLQFFAGAHVGLKLNSSEEESGWRVPFSLRRNQDLHPTFELKVPPGNSHLLIKYEGPDFYLNVAAPAVTHRNSMLFEVGLIFLLATFLSLGAYNFFLYLMTLDKAYLYYALRCLASMTMSSVEFNFLLKYIWPESTLDTRQLAMTILSITVFSWLPVTRQFLSLDQHMNRTLTRGIFHVLGFGLLASALFPWIFPDASSDILFRALGPMTFLAMLGTGSYMCFRRYRPAYFYMFGATAYFAGVIIHILITESVLARTPFLSLATPLGAAIEALMMSFGLGDKYMAFMKEANRTLNVRNLELNKLSRLKDEFLANTSHELRTPLNGILGIADSMVGGAAGAINDKAKYNLQLIASSARRLSNLINDILDFSKLKSHQIQLRVSSIHLREIGSIVLQVNGVMVESKNIKLINSIPADLPPLMGDEARIQQILYNLIGNAIKFTREGEIELGAKAERGELIVSIRDTGIGIPADKFDSIFDSFEQVDGSISREFGGTGIGLSITRQIVHLHKGRIWLESTLGQGSTFYFSLPLAGSAVSMPPAPARTTGLKSLPSLPQMPMDFQLDSPKEDESIVFAEGENIRILIADDEPINIQVLRNYLAFDNIELMVATNGEEVLSLIREKGKPTLILLDIMMPRKTGYEVMRELRETYKFTELPIIVLTAKNQIDDLTQAFQLGANDYITKPFLKSEIFNRMKTHMELSRLTNRLEGIVREKTRDIGIMLQSLEQGIFSITRAGKIHHEYSEFLKSIFEVEDVTQEDPFTLLLGQTDASEDTIDQIKNSVMMAIDSDMLFFEGNSHTLPREIVRRKDQKTQILEVDWRPLLNDTDKVDKIMVVVRDVTDLRALQEETRKNQRDLQIIGQILAASIPSFEKFSGNSERLMDQNQKAIESRSSSDSIDIELLFRNIHTIKGNARTFGLLFIANVAHEIENYLVELRFRKINEPDRHRLKNDLQRLQQIHTEYSAIVSNRLTVMHQDAKDDLVDRLNQLHLEQSNLTSIKENFFEIAEQKRMDRFFPTLECMLSPTIKSLEKTAVELCKPMPEIQFSGESLHLNIEMEALIQNVFTHLFRNSMDHGLETPDQRLQVGKTAKGRITIEESVSGSDLMIAYSDDGGGLNLHVLARKVKDPEATDEQIAETIFQSGVSTAEQVTQISGRGIGMDAVRTYLTEVGGNISIAFLQPKNSSGRRSFKFLVTLPLSCVWSDVIPKRKVG